MPIHVELSGLHARSEQLIDLTRDYERNQASWSDVRRELLKETSDLVSLQENSSSWDYVSDGAMGWKDQLRPIIESITGLADSTRYSRWYDTNTFYQKPIVTGKIELGKFEPTKFIETSVLPKNRPWKISLPGPYTLASLSEDKYYQNERDLVHDFALVLKEIVRGLGKEGIVLVQLSEPSLVYWPYRENPPTSQELRQGIEAVETVTDVSSVKFLLATFFGDSAPLLHDLLRLPVRSIGIDLYETNWKSLPKIGSNTGLFLGIVDSEESGIETPEWIADTTTKIVESTGASNVTIGPNTDLKFVPRLIADQKLASLEKAVGILAARGFN